MPILKFINEGLGMKGWMSAVGLVFGITGCSIQPKLIKEDFIKTNISLNVNIYENRKAMRLDINKRFPTVERNIEGLAIWFLNDKDNTCNIFVTSPKNDFDINTWGHELAHCVYGSWHQ